MKTSASEAMNHSDIEKAEELARLVEAQGGRAYYAGGFVRDSVLGRSSKDIDIEVHGLSAEQLSPILNFLGSCTYYGGSFGIYSIKGYGLEISLPMEKAQPAPHIGTEAAAKRRDFTVNSMMRDILSGELIDHFGGEADIRAGIIRHTADDCFIQDPLRVFRAAQFSATLGFDIAEETLSLCRGADVSALPKERVEAELKKALLKAEKPSRFFESLRAMEKLSPWFEELEALIGIEQNPVYHAEGDVWTHSMMVVDAAAKLRKEADDAYTLMLSALCHDFGKAVCTEVIDGKIHAYQHETKGQPLVESFMRRLTNEAKLIRNVVNLSFLHMKPNILAACKASVKSTNRMYDSAHEPMSLLCLALADSRGQICTVPNGTNEAYLYERLALYREYMARPYVSGRDLIEAGLKPDEKFSQALDYAHKLRLAGVEKQNALKQTLAYYRKL